MAAAALGAVIAILLEWVAVAFGAWSYSARMPVVPLLEVGLWPMLQLALRVPLALWAAMRGRKGPPQPVG